MMTRVLAAAVGLALVLPVLIWGGTIGIDVLAGLVLLVLVDEYVGMVAPGRRARTRVVLAVPALTFYVSVLYGPPGSSLVAAVGGVLWLFGAALFRSAPVAGEEGDPVSAADAAARLVLGFVWVGGLWTCLPLVRRFDQGLGWVFLLLVVTWMGDTGAYFAGRALGRRKLYEKISPKKTWEGAIGGLVLSVVGALVVRHLMLPSTEILAVVLVAIVLDVAGVSGDLFESMLKRSYGVKDSGGIMPGHGGLLDRVDSLLVSGPVLFAILSTLDL